MTTVPQLQAAQQAPEEQESNLNSIENYWKNHAVKVKLETIYTKEVLTWAGDSDQKTVLLLQSHILPEERTQYMHYDDYMNGKENFINHVDLEHGTCFKLMTQKIDGESIFVLNHVRKINRMDYTTNVFIARDQNLFAIECKDQSQPKFDIFKGLNNHDFFKEKQDDTLDKKCKEFVGTINVKSKAKKVAFARNSQFCAAFSTKSFELFELSQSTSVNDDSDEKLIKPFFSMYDKDPSWNNAYDKLLAVYLGEGDDKQTIFNNTWLILQSKNFSLVHLVKLSLVKAWIEQTDQSEDRSILFDDQSLESNLDQQSSENSLKVKIDSLGQPDEFWQKTHGLFSASGKQAILYTSSELFKVDLRSIEEKQNQDKIPKKRIEQILGLSGKKNQIFKQDKDDFIFVVKETGSTINQLSFISTNENFDEQLNGIKIDISRFDWDSFKLLEVSVQKNGYLRLIGVRGELEVMICEQKLSQVLNASEGRQRSNTITSKTIRRQQSDFEEAPSDKQEFEDMFPTKLTAIQMPYVAYSVQNRIVNIIPLFEPEKVIRLEVKNMKPNEEIQKLVFNFDILYIITRCENKHDNTLTKFYVYEVQVGKDLNRQVNKVEERLYEEGKAPKSIYKGPIEEKKIQHLDFQKKKSLIKEEGDLSDVSTQKYGPFIIQHAKERSKVTETDLQDAFILDKEGAMYDRVFIFHCEHRLYVIQQKSSALQKDKDKNLVAEEIYPGAKPMKEFCKINGQNFVFTLDDPNDSKVYHLHVNGIDPPKVEVAFSEQTYKFICVKADYRGLYVLVQDRYYNHYLRILTMVGETDITFQQTSFVQINKSDPFCEQFINTFNFTKNIIDGVMIHNSHMFSQILVDPLMPGIRHIQKFLSKNYYNHDGLTLMTSDILTNSTNRKLGLILARPQTQISLAQPRLLMILPYMFDNEIKLTRSVKTQITWVSHVYEKPQQKTQTSQKKDVAKAYVYQFNTNKWRLSKFNLAGVCLRSKSFKGFDQAVNDNFKCAQPDPRQYKILAIHPKEPRFLITPTDTDFYKKLILVKVNDNFTLKIEWKWDLSVQEYMLDNPQKGEEKLQLYNVLKAQSQMSDGRLEFQVNSFKDLSIAFFDKSSVISRYLLLIKPRDENPDLKPFIREVVLPNALNNVKENLKTGLQKKFKLGFNKSRIEELKEPLLEVKETADKNNVQPQGQGAIGSLLADKKVLLWTGGRVYYANLVNEVSLPTQNQKLQLTPSTKFNLPTHNEKEGSAGTDNTFHQFETTIEHVMCRSTKKEAPEGSEQTSNETSDYVYIKVLAGESEAIMILFDLDKEKQLHCLCATRNADFLFDSDDVCYVFDVDGIKKLSNGESYFEYHVENLATETFNKYIPGFSWGCRMVPSFSGILLLINEKIVLPYNAIGCISNSQTIDTDLCGSQIFYPRDYYKIAGQTLLHRYKYNPGMLAKILDCYWKSDKNYILSVLVKSSKYEIQKIKDKESTALLKQAKVIIGKYLKQETFTIKIEQTQTKADKSILDCMIELSDDLLVNQILYMLSQLNIEFSFVLCMPQFKELVQYSQFQTYFNTWFTQSPQLEYIKVLQFNDNNEEKNAEYRNDLTLIDQNFFNQFPLPSSDSTETDAAETKTSSESLLTLEDQKVLRRVQVRVLNTLWFTEQEGIDFFNQLQDVKDIKIFDNPDLKAIIDFRWNMFLNFYKRIVFLPFMFMAYIPFVVFAIFGVDIPDQNQNEITQTGISTTGWVSFCLIWTYIVYQLWWEYKEFYERKSNLLAFISDPATIFNWLSLLVISISTTSAVVIFSREDDLYSTESLKPSIIRILFVAGVFQLNIVMLYYVHVFDFWSTFVRSLVNIIKSALPLAACLFIFVFTQTLMFYIMHDHSIFEKNGKHEGFWKVFILSYTFTLGDFAISDIFKNTDGDMSGDTLNNVVYWIIFIVGTVIQLLVILNMVIAVMSNAFDEVTATDNANIYRAKLQCLQSYNAVYMATPFFANEVRERSYLFLLNIDPVINDLGTTLMAEMPEAQVTNDIAKVQKLCKDLQVNLFSTKNSQQILFSKVDAQYNLLEKINARLEKPEKQAK